ncbi:MAG: hypothetical protein KHZ82_02570 [Peptoniphilus harei]|nr:hypothetical protein [Peptoniphilus harei]
MLKYRVNCTLNLEKELEIFAKNEDEAYENAEAEFWNCFSNEFMKSGMDFEVLTENELDAGDIYDLYEER